MAHSSMEGLFFYEVEDDFEEQIRDEKRSGDSKMEKPYEKVQVCLCNIL